LLAGAGLVWDTMYWNTLANPWVISNGNTSIRFVVDDSLDCGGASDNGFQAGTATAAVTVGASPVHVDFSLSGMASANGYYNEVMVVFIVVRGEQGFGDQAAGTSLSDTPCATVPVTVERYSTWPRTLAPGTVVDIEVNFYRFVSAWVGCGSAGFDCTPAPVFDGTCH